MTAKHLISTLLPHATWVYPTILHFSHTCLQVVQGEVAHLVLDIAPVHDGGRTRIVALQMDTGNNRSRLREALSVIMALQRTTRRSLYV